MVYMFPTNPELHPSSIYPNQQFSRGKVRDLPDSGVIYLNRIKPIGQELSIPIPDSLPIKTDKSSEIVKKSTFPSSFEKYSSVEERSPMRNKISSWKATEKATDYVANIRDSKIDEAKKSVQKTKIPEEIELDNLLDDLLKNGGKTKKISGLQKIGKSSKRHVGNYKPKLIAFDGTARVTSTSSLSKPANPVTVRLMQRKVYSPKNSNNDADFDPWERIQQ